MDIPALESTVNQFEFWVQLFAVIVAVGIVGEVALGYKLWRATQKLSAAQRKEIVALQNTTAEAKQKQTEAAERLEKLKIRQEPRIATVGQLAKALESKPPGKAEILFQEGDGEVFQFAGWLKSILVYSKWEVSEPRIIGETVSGSYSGIPVDELRKFPSPMRLGAAPVGVSIIANRKTMDRWFSSKSKEINPLKALLSALNDSDIRVGLGQDDSSLPDDFLRIVIAPK